MRKLLTTLCVAAFAVALAFGIARASTAAIATFSQLIFGQYNATAPTLADGQTAPLELDANGNAMTRTASTSGASQTLANAVVATANQTFTSTTLGAAKRVTLCMSASGATTFTVKESIDGTTFYVASLNNTATDAKYVPAAAGTLCEAITPAPFVQVATSAAVTVTVQAQAAY